mgnify:FL=1
MTKHHDRLPIPKNYQEWVQQGKLFNPALLHFMVWDYQEHKWVEAGFRPLFKTKPS